MKQQKQDLEDGRTESDTPFVQPSHLKLLHLNNNNRINGDKKRKNFPRKRNFFLRARKRRSGKTTEKNRRNRELGWDNKTIHEKKKKIDVSNRTEDKQTNKPQKRGAFTSLSCRSYANSSLSPTHLRKQRRGEKRTRGTGNNTGTRLEPKGDRNSTTLPLGNPPFT